MTERPFNVLGIQQIAIGGLDKGALTGLWTGLLGVEKVGDYVALDGDVVKQARSAVKQAEVSIGSITGSLDAIKKVRNGVRATIYDPVRHRAVTCSAGLQMADDIRKAWDHRVTLRGRITRNAYGQPIRMTVNSLEVLPDDDSNRAPVRDLHGALPDMTGGLSVSGFLDRARRRA